MKSLPLGNSKGISVLLLLVAMLLMMTMGYVLTYLIPAKQKSVAFPIYSTQAFFLAQSGVEYAFSHAIVNGFSDLNPPGVQRDLGNGRFTISYDGNTLTSVGEIPNLSQRTIVITDFSNLVSGMTNP